jgi:nucleoside-diphosphate-sugar epimerase
MATIALTGATGFVGQEVVAQLLAGGHSVRALTRRTQDAQDGLTWVEGTLDDVASLTALANGADAVLHIAGAVNVPTRADFARANIDGTANMIAGATAAGVARFVHVSSLSAREPLLSNYSWSKAEAERVVEASDRQWTIIRPPAIYGPRDKDMLDLFRMAKRGIMLLPPAGRTSVIHVEDLARLLISATLSDDPALTHRILEPDDGTPGGLTHRQMGAAIGQAVGRARLATLSAPRWLLHTAARGDRLVRRDKAKLTPDRAGYMSHPNWVCTPAFAPPRTLWTPHIRYAEGFGQTAQWYADNGWL